MSAPIKEIAPTMIVAAVATWCCWSYLDEPRTGAKQEGDLPKIEDAMLHPVLEPVCKRDSFKPTDAAGVILKKDQGQVSSSDKSDGLTALMGREQGLLSAVAEIPLVQKAGDLFLRRFLGKSPPSIDDQASERTSETDGSDRLQSLVVGGHVHSRRTPIRTDQRPCLSAGGPAGRFRSGEEPGIVKEISEHRVLVLHRGKTLVLTYPDPPRDLSRRRD